jgi:hypothetical protein
MGLHNSVRNKGCGYLSSTKPTAIESLDGFFGIFDGVEFDIDLALRMVSNKSENEHHGSLVSPSQL